jgi:hypothetical protein
MLQPSVSRMEIRLLQGDQAGRRSVFDIVYPTLDGIPTAATSARPQNRAR